MSKIIPLGGRKGEGMIALVDDSDYEWLSEQNWLVRYPGPYAVRYAGSENGRTLIVSMHTEIMRTPEGMHTDHINGNGLDNRRCNLRVCTAAQNLWNKAPVAGKRFKGITLMGKRWRAMIQTNGKQRHLGLYATEEEAARAYDEAARKCHGEFARLNFPTEQEQPQ